MILKVKIILWMKAKFHRRNEVIKILLLILHIALVILCVLNAKNTDFKLTRCCWIFSSIIWLILTANDIFHFL